MSPCSYVSKRPAGSSPTARSCVPCWGGRPDLLDRLFGHSKIFGGANDWWPARPYQRPAPLEPVAYERFPDSPGELRSYHTMENLLKTCGKPPLSARLKRIAAQKNLRVVIPRD